MALDRARVVIQDDAGNIVNGTSVEVTLEAAGFPLVSVYSDFAGNTPLGNPYVAADGGDAGFHAVGGYYRVRAYLGPSGAPTFERIIRYVAVGTSKALDAFDQGAYREVTEAGPVTVGAADKILGINKTVGEATTVNIPLAAARNGVSITIKDVKGDADVNPITPAFTGGELADGQAGSAYQITTPFGSVTFHPRNGAYIVQTLVADSIATRAEAEAGVNDTKLMSPKKTRQALGLTPFGKAGIKVLRYGDSHFGFNNFIFSTATAGKWVIVYRYAQDHGLVEGSQIRAADSYDNGMTLVNERVIYSDSSFDTRNFVAAEMGSDRLGILCSRRDESLAYTDTVFIYSDDDGVTWSTVTITSPSAGYAINFHGGILPYPAAVGGHDTLGFAAYSYGAGSGIDVFTTIDNGANWTITQDVVTNDGTFTLSEMAVQRVGDENKWIMVMRTGQTNAAAAVSSNMTTWTGPSDTGLVFKGNPPALIYHDEEMWFIGFSRRSREIETDLASHIVYAKANASDLYDADGNFASLGAGWNVLTPVPDWASGYMFPTKIGDKWWASFTCGEQPPLGTTGPKANMLCVIGDFINIGTNPHDIIRGVPRKNVLANGGFESWRNGTSFTLTSATATETADGWLAAADSSDSTAVTRESFTPGQNEVPGNPTYYLRYASSSVVGGSSHYISHRPGRVSLLADKRCTLSFWARMPSGDKANIGRIRIIQNFGTGGTPSTAVNFTIISGQAVSATWQRYELSFNMPSIEGMTLGTNQNDYLWLLFYPIWAEEASYDLQIADVKLEQSPYASPFERETAAEARARLGALMPISGTFTDGGVLFGAGAGPVEVSAAPTDGQLFVGATGSNPTPRTISGDITIGSTGVTAIGANKVLNTMLRQGAALSVIGNITNGTANVADIAAASDHQIMRRSGTAVGFGSVNLAESGAVGSSILGLANGGTGQNAASARALCAALGIPFKLAQSGAASSHTGDTIETTLATVTVPADAMGPNGIIRISHLWQFNATANGKTPRIRFGGTEMFAQSLTGSQIAGNAETIIRNLNATNSQAGWIDSFSSYTVGTAALNTATVDTTASQDITFSGTLTNAGDTITLLGYTVEVIYGA